MGHHHHHMHSHKSNNHGALPTSPAPFHEKKSLLGRMRERFAEKPATREEVDQLKLQSEREKYKTEKAIYRQKRPSLLSKIAFGGGSSHGSSSHGSVRRQNNARFVDDSSSSLLGSGSMLTGSPSYKGMDEMLGTGGAYKQPSGRKTIVKEKPFGSGLDDLFGNG